MSIVTPKHTGELHTFFSPLEVLSNHDDWIDNETFKRELFEIYKRDGKASEYIIDDDGNPAMKTDESDYTSDLQLPLYFGFAVGDSLTNAPKKKITESGRELLKAYQDQDEEKIKSLFLQSLATCPFGRKNFGCYSSDSIYEAPAILLRSIVLLNGVSRKEFVYLLKEIDEKGRDFSEVLSDIAISDRTVRQYENLNTDLKFITLFCKLGFLKYDDADRLQLDSFSKNDVYNLPITNNSKSVLLNGNLQNVELIDVVKEAFAEYVGRVSPPDTNNQQYIKDFEKNINKCLEGHGTIYSFIELEQLENLLDELKENNESLKIYLSENKDKSLGGVNYRVWITLRKYFDFLKVLRDSREIIKHMGDSKSRKSNSDFIPKQIIYFGAPGSGKSSTIKKQYEKDESRVHRTTFHPDSDYSTFVGCYKPMTDIERDSQGKIISKRITYEFTPQVFTDAYVDAWNDPEHMYYLVIEEINRGNCAQVFGDLFQLLDRKLETGMSEYRIKADKDLRDYLESKLHKDSYGIADGKLCLPANLSIIASMNTSDQSLFPMDSAFKRRWAWRYIPIDFENKRSSAFLIRTDTNIYSWNKFLYMINREVKRVTSSEDKQMGNFFIKDNISEKDFVDKVMFYIWSEVGKDNYQTKDAIFVYDNEKNEPVEFSFNELFTSKRTTILDRFIKKLEKKYGKDYEDFYKSVGNTKVSDKDYSFDGKVYTSKEYSALGVAIVRKYIQHHNGLEFKELSKMLDDARLLRNTTNGSNVLMTPEMMKQTSSYEDCYLLENNTYDGQEYYIFKSWGHSCIQDIVDFAIAEGLMSDSENGLNNGAESGATESAESEAAEGAESEATEGAESEATEGAESGATEGAESEATDGAENGAANGALE